MYLLSVFTSLYEWCIGANDDPVYKDEVFSSVGVFTLLIALVFCLIFYVGLGRWKPVFYRLNHWVITIILLSVLSGFLALGESKGATQATFLDSYMISFAVYNALFAAICFIILSFILKKASIFSKRTPF